MKKGARAMFDGVWSHMRNAYQHHAILIEFLTGKIIASQVIFKNDRANLGNYEDKKPSNLMEISALRLMKDDLVDERICSFCSEGDIKIKNFIKTLDRKTPLTFSKDPGHECLSIIRSLKILSSKNSNVFQPLINNFTKFLEHIVIKIVDPVKREKVYLNISAHYSGKHDPELCMHSQNSIYVQFFNSTNNETFTLFQNFLNKTLKHIREIVPGQSTQLNESFNHHSKKFINKLYSYRSFYRLRSAISMLDWNEPFYINEILKRLDS
ncbi:hypothetical protein M9Y10_016487 [Tritrichomonas musculus]|uniref:Uncharacterized protein n=1 Tax=Tritrichomonas musculus TaxID=1915356 RepID=A0ABR2HWG5_9EUKA